MSKIELARKLKTLMERTENRNERMNAEQRLSDLMAKHGITEDMLADEMVQVFWMGFNNDEWAARLFCQVVSNVCEVKRDCHEMSLKSKKKEKWDGIVIEYRVTMAEKIQIHFTFNHFLERFREEMQVFYVAYIQKNELFSNPLHAGQSSGSLTDRQRRALKMARGVAKKDIHLALGEA